MVDQAGSDGLMLPELGLDLVQCWADLAEFDRAEVRGGGASAGGDASQSSSRMICPEEVQFRNFEDGPNIKAMVDFVLHEDPPVPPSRRPWSELFANNRKPCAAYVEQD
ncbi:hypothetical protein Dimus_016457 [Dionaea muscipula]